MGLGKAVFAIRLGDDEASFPTLFMRHSTPRAQKCEPLGDRTQVDSDVRAIHHAKIRSFNTSSHDQGMALPRPHSYKRDWHNDRKNSLERMRLFEVQEERKRTCPNKND